MGRGLRWGVAILVLLGLGWAGWTYVWQSRRSVGPTLVLVDPEMEEGSGLGEAHRLALGNLLQDVLESSARSPIFRLPFAPALDVLKEKGGKGLVVRLRAHRRGDHLHWVLRWATVEELKAGGGYRELKSPSLPPREAIAWVLAHLPLRAEGSALKSLLPESEPAFWAFLDASALSNSGQDRERAIQLLEGLSQRHPGSAVFRLQLGIQLYFRMGSARVSTLQDQARAKSELEACLQLRPYLGRAVQYLSRLQTDTGSVRDALLLLQEARRHRPECVSILSAVSYPARYAGLLSLSDSAAQLGGDLNPVRGRPLRLAFHLLYLERLDEFQASLWEWPGDFRNATCRFHRANLALIRGDRQGALVLFRETEQMKEGAEPYQGLSRAYRQILEGDLVGARTTLRGIQALRAGLRVSDGEVTLTLAGAYALLGEASTAMELMRGAFSQGFGCARWFEKDPTLAPARTLPEWAWLQQHLLERQSLFEARFPKKSFGL